MSSDDDDPGPSGRACRQPQIDNSNLELPALFWDNIPEGAENHPDYAAMQALADEMKPEERAENFKAIAALPPSGRFHCFAPELRCQLQSCCGLVADALSGAPHGRRRQATASFSTV